LSRCGERKPPKCRHRESGPDHRCASFCVFCWLVVCWKRRKYDRDERPPFAAFARASSLAGTVREVSAKYALRIDFLLVGACAATVL